MRHAWVQVSVGGLLDRHFGYNFEENIKYGGCVQQQNKEGKARTKCVVRVHS
jgi:hypothetical protein